MFKYLILTLCLIFAAMTGIYFFVGVPQITPTDSPRLTTPHLYNNPDISIENIHISAIYFVPKNKNPTGGWKETMDAGLKKLQKFHQLQFQRRSEISYEIFPEPVIGEEENLFYDTANTGRGNPQALINTANEIERRIFQNEGDLAKVNFSRGPESAYPALFVMYEGVGASGGIINESEEEATTAEIAKKLNLPESVIFAVDVHSSDGFFLVNREIADGTHGPNGQSVLAHEFYHTLGLPDEYSLENGIAKSPDIMGLGRFKPVENTYLSLELLAGLGL